MRATVWPFGATITGTSICPSLSRTESVAADGCVPNSGWKQPAVSPAAASTTATAAARRQTAFRLHHHIDDPSRHHDHLLRTFAVERLFYRIERQDGSLNFGRLGVARHRHLGALLAVDLDRQRDPVLDQQIVSELRPLI